MLDIEDLLINNPIIAAIKNDNDLEKVLKTDIKIVFVLYGTITNISDIAKKLHDKDKIIFIHAELIDGLKANESGLLFIKTYANPVGIISTKTSQIRIAKKHNLYAILRLFIVDSISLNTAIKTTKDNNPSAIEVMPATSYRAIGQICNCVDKVPVIAGGLVEDKKDVLNALEKGVVAVSTTSKKVWNM